MNRVILIGRLTKDPELRYTSNNIPFVRFTIAVNRIYQSKDGEKQADFISCIAWRNQAENLARFMKKGSLIGVDGQIQTSSFDDPQGVRRYNTDVVCENIHFLESRQSQPSQGFGGYSDFNDQSYQNYSAPRQQAPEKQKDPFEDIISDFDVSNDDLPF